MKLLSFLFLLTVTLSLQLSTTMKQCPCDQQGCPSCMLGNALRQSHEAAEQLVNPLIKEH